MKVVHSESCERWEKSVVFEQTEDGMWFGKLEPLP